MNMQQLAPMTSDGVVTAAWIASQQSAKTRRDYAKAAAIYAAWRDQHGLTLPMVTPAHLGAWRANMEAHGLSPATIATYLAIGRSLHTFAWRNNYCPHNPGAAVKSPRIPRVHISDWQRIVAAAVPIIQAEPDPRKKLFFETLYYTASRVGALCDLRWRDVVPMASGDGALLDMREKGGEQPLRPISQAHYLRIIALRKPDALDTDTVFGVGVRRAQQWVAVAAKRIGVTGFSAHSFRHAAITHLLEADWSPGDVKALSGHRSAAFERYIHYVPKKQAEETLCVH